MEKEFIIAGLETGGPLDTDTYRILEPLVNEVAGREWKRSALYSMEDVTQAIWLHMVDNWPHYANQEEGLIRHMARRAARAFCHEQRNEYMYATGAFLYTPAMVRRFLEDVVFCSPENCKDIEARADISEAYTHLPKQQKAAVYKRYAMGETLISGAEKVAESRAITTITARLNNGLRLTSATLPDE